MTIHRCPYCGSPNIQYAAASLQHSFRVLVGSPKRFCLNCKKKWILKSMDAHMPGILIIGVLLAAVLSVFLIGKMTGLTFHSTKRQAGKPALNPKLIEKARKKMAQNPNVLVHLSPDNPEMAES
jgi:hypothetical protein